MNTLNICIGHLPFPNIYSNYVDILLSPTIVGGDVKRKIIIPDDIYGENGNSLSEYAQLFWINNNIEKIAIDIDYFNIFQYRRFLSSKPIDIKKVPGLPWANLIDEEELGNYHQCFERNQDTTYFNTPVNFGEVGVIYQYNEAHELEDYLNFAQFLLQENILDKNCTIKFIQQKLFIPSCSIGIYHIEKFKEIFTYLESAARFINSQKFQKREGYQRRSAGYLLERFHSYLILEHFGSGCKFGSNVFIQRK